ncbi:MAG: secreted PhoX family phosphatase [Sphingobacteriales bacterium]|jgi:secreted PhoX family phosphatase
MQLPARHSFQFLIIEGAAYNTGGETLGNNFDFTAYIPKSGSSKSGYLGINHENPTGSVYIMDVAYD